LWDITSTVPDSSIDWSSIQGFLRAFWFLSVPALFSFPKDPSTRALSISSTSAGGLPTVKGKTENLNFALGDPIQRVY